MQELDQEDRQHLILYEVSKKIDKLVGNKHQAIIKYRSTIPNYNPLIDMSNYNHEEEIKTLSRDQINKMVLYKIYSTNPKYFDSSDLRTIEAKQPQAAIVFSNIGISALATIQLLVLKRRCLLMTYRTPLILTGAYLINTGIDELSKKWVHWKKKKHIFALGQRLEFQFGRKMMEKISDPRTPMSWISKVSRDPKYTIY